MIWPVFTAPYSPALFGVSLAAVLTIFLLAMLSNLTGRFEFWPPPASKSWQHRTFLLLFRLFLYPLLALTVLEYEFASDTLGLWRQFVGGLLLLVGFGLAFRITLQMGWRNAFGEKKGLVTDGWFAVSRNPVYVVTWIGLLGWGLIVGHAGVTILVVLWAGLYVAAPFLEECWLEQEYGEEYRRYKSSVARFL
jgi:protein-S-isoprenylcysteine O-methyltransferase Ste14